MKSSKKGVLVRISKIDEEDLERIADAENTTAPDIFRRAFKNYREAFYLAQKLEEQAATLGKVVHSQNVNSEAINKLAAVVAEQQQAIINLTKIFQYPASAKVG